MVVIFDECFGPECSHRVQMETSTVLMSGKEIMEKFPDIISSKLLFHFYTPVSVSLRGLCLMTSPFSHYVHIEYKGGQKAEKTMLIEEIMRNERLWNLLSLEERDYLKSGSEYLRIRSRLPKRN